VNPGLLAHVKLISVLTSVLLGDFVVVFGLTRKSKCRELQKQRDELQAYMNVLTGEVETLRKGVAELKKEMRVSKQKIWRLQEETNSLRIERQGLANSVEILTKEREIFQKTIQDLCQVVKKQKQVRHA
jgi:predicted nuclease with TOPRIM domain